MQPLARGDPRTDGGLSQTPQPSPDRIGETQITSAESWADRIAPHLRGAIEHIAAYLTVAAHFQAIRGGLLYRAAGYETFEWCLESRWSLGDVATILEVLNMAGMAS